MSGLVLHDDEWYERNSITAWLNTVVDEIDREARAIVLATGERLPYDRLVLATGATATLPPIAGLDDASVFVMRTAEDATRIRALAQRAHARRAVVVGGGLLGLETAHALNRLGLRVAIVQRSPRLLAGHLDRRGSQLVEQYMRGVGIGIALGATPIAVTRTAEGASVVLDDDDAVGADLIVVCTGITPATDLAVRAGLAVDRGILVDDAMRTSDPFVFAAGDVAQHESGMPGLWPAAVAQAEVAAASAVGEERVYAPTPAVAVLKGVGLTVMSAGELDGTAGEAITRESTDDDLRYWKLVVRDGVAVGAVVVGDWPLGSLLVDAVVAGRDVGSALPALRDGDLSVLVEA